MGVELLMRLAGFTLAKQPDGLKGFRKDCLPGSEDHVLVLPRYKSEIDSPYSSITCMLCDSLDNMMIRKNYDTLFDFLESGETEMIAARKTAGRPEKA